MLKSIENFVQQKDNGLMLLDLPTGFGKTTSVIQFIEKFINLINAHNTAEMLNMLAIQRKTLLDGIHADERKIYCLDYLVNKLKK